MKLRNGFNQNTRNLFLYEYSCWNCHRSDLGLELHHREGRVSDSPLNCCLLCPRCHAKGQRDEEFKGRMKNKVLDFLERQEYILNKEDEEFYDKYFN